jgi:hypothetical protein
MMMLFDQEGGNMAGRQERGREIMSATVKVKLELGNVTWRPEKGHLAPEVKVANEITCDYTLEETGIARTSSIEPQQPRN